MMLLTLGLVVGFLAGLLVSLFAFCIYCILSALHDT